MLGSSEQDDETRIIGSSPVASDVTMVLSADTAAVAQSGLPRVISSGQEYADATRALGDIAGAGETSVFPNGQRGVSDVGVVTGKTGTLGSAHDARVQHAGRVPRIGCIASTLRRSRIRQCFGWCGSERGIDSCFHRRSGDGHRGA